MQLSDIKKVGIIGSGTMGSGIAQVFALHGYSVIMYDLKESFLEKAIQNITRNLDKGIERGKVSKDQKSHSLDQITFTTDLGDVIADFVIEAVIEDLNIKGEIFSQLQKQNGEEAILATNTSSLPVTSIGNKLSNPRKLVGMHFFNPAHIMKLVEVVSGIETSEETAQVTYQLSEKIGKRPVYAKDSPGFIVNRVARHYYVEGLKLLEENIADHSAIDRLLESSGFKMGPFRLMDLIGVDANFNVTKTMYEQFHYDGKFRPSRIQQQKVEAGHTGRKSGKGFYDYK